MRALTSTRIRAPRAIAAVVIGMLAGCLGVGGGGGSRPSVLPMLSELPTDPEKRDAILDRSGQTPGPEHHRKPLASPKQHKAETTAATAAAILGSMFSKTQNVTIGQMGTFDENVIVAPPPPLVSPRPAAPDRDATAEPAPDGATLVPWVKLK